MESSEVTVPINAATVLKVNPLPTGEGCTVVLDVAGALLVAYAGKDEGDYAAGEQASVRLRVYTGNTIDTSPVKRPLSFMQCFRMAWREADEPRMKEAGWNSTVPDIIAWGAVDGLSDFGVIVAIHGVRFEVQMEEPIRTEFQHANRYAFRGGLHAIRMDG